MKKSKQYIKSHNLVNRCYDMLSYYNTFQNKDLSYKEIKTNIYNNLREIETVETYAKYFNLKLKSTKNKVELKYNLKDLINDLNYLKQHLEKELTSSSQFFNND